MNGLMYIGKGAFIAGIPARDLTPDEIATLPMSREDLIKTGLYKEPDLAGRKKDLSQKDKE